MPSRFQFPMNFDKQIIAQIILVFLFLIACFWIAIQPNPFEVQHSPSDTSSQPMKPDPTLEALKATAYQVEIEENRDQTIGVLFGGSILVVIIVAGTLLIMNKE
ncbi:MAG: hypothetical protein GX577_02260 [Leptolinea sp.]|nr:hypothetical protein [Leptolinea sp.]